MRRLRIAQSTLSSIHAQPPSPLRVLCFFAIACTLLACPSALLAQAPPPGEAVAFHKLRPKDVIAISVFNESDLRTQGPLDIDGSIVIPLIGRVSLDGLTLRQAENRIRELFIAEDFLIDPQVTVSVTAYAGEVFYIYGEVANPGAKAFPPGRKAIDIMEALTMSGDFTEFAKRSEVILRRVDPDSGREVSQTIDFDRLLRGRGNERLENIEVRPGDILFIPERLF